MQSSPETPRGRPNKVDPLDSVLFGAGFSQPMRLSSPTRAPQRAASPSRPALQRETTSQEPQQREPTSPLPRSAPPQHGGSLRDRAAVPPRSPEVKQSKSPGRRASFNGTVEFAPAYQPPAGWNVRWSPGAARVCTLSEDALTVTGQFPTRVYSDESLPAFRSAMVNICLTKVPQSGVCSIGIARKNCRNPAKKLDSNLGRGDDSIGLMLYTAHTCDIETAGQVVQDNVHPRISAGTVISLNWNGSAGTLAFAIHGHTLGQSIRVRQGSDVYAVGLKEGAEFVIVNSRLL